MSLTARSLCTALIATAFHTAPTTLLADDALQRVVAGDHRTESNRVRDEYRHPIDTLEFFGLEPGMDIVELWPGGGGYYFEILAPYMAGDGGYTAAIFGPGALERSDYYGEANDGFRAKLEAHPELYAKVEVVEFWPTDEVALGAPGSKDMVLTFRNFHNWLMRGHADEALAKIHEVLDDGGLLAVVDHRADPRRPLDPGAGSGYVDEVYAIQRIQAAGFELVAASDVNDNPADPSDHPRGVWTLPPSLRLGETDRDRYLAIGESDRFTLLFRKRD